MISGAKCGDAPSDTIILFDGENLDEWVSAQNHTPARGAPIKLQAHGDKSEPLSFRNIWVRELK